MKCFLCGCGESHKREGKVRDNPNIEILECNECGLVFLDSQNISDEFYASGQMHNQAEIYKLTERTDFINDMYPFNRARLDFVLNSIIGKDLLDFGSGYAGFLILAKEFARSVAGVELESNVEPIYAKHNITLFKHLDSLLNIDSSDMRFCNDRVNADSTHSVASNLLVNSRGGGEMRFDIITAFHVIEHLQEPLTILRQLTSLLRDKGKMIIEVPNANDALLTIYKSKAFQEFTYWSPHLYLYSPHTLKKLGEKAGLKVDFVKGIQRYPLSNTLYWLSFGLPAGQKIWGNFIDNKVLQESYESSLASLGATDTLIAQFSKI